MLLPADVQRDHKGQKNELSQIVDDIECLAEECALFKWLCNCYVHSGMPSTQKNAWHLAVAQLAPEE